MDDDLADDFIATGLVYYEEYSDLLRYNTQLVDPLVDDWSDEENEKKSKVQKRGPI